MTRVAFCVPSTLDSNSGYHVQGLATALERRGLECATFALADEPGHYRFRGAGQQPNEDTIDWSALGSLLAQIQSPDIVHLWTTRAVGVRLMSLIQAHADSRIRVVLHLEDDETAIATEFSGVATRDLSAMTIGEFTRRYGMTWTHPRWHKMVTQLADGITSLTVAAMPIREVPRAVFSPGFDEGLFAPIPAFDRARLRASLGLNPSQLVLVYTGNVHPPVERDFLSLLGAVQLLRRQGIDVVLLSSGAIFSERVLDLHGRSHEIGWRPMGWLRRTEVRDLMAIGDLAVQPGRQSNYNRSRFPSKVPEQLALGIPTLLSSTFECSQQMAREGAVVPFVENSSLGIAQAIEGAVGMPSALERLSANGRLFAGAHLGWDRAAVVVEALYEEVLAT